MELIELHLDDGTTWGAWGLRGPHCPRGPRGPFGQWNDVWTTWTKRGQCGPRGPNVDSVDHVDGGILWAELTFATNCRHGELAAMGERDRDVKRRDPVQIGKNDIAAGAAVGSIQADNVIRLWWLAVGESLAEEEEEEEEEEEDYWRKIRWSGYGGNMPWTEHDGAGTGRRNGVDMAESNGAAGYGGKMEEQ
ncbi:hypothetical protein CBR_g34625 [Chara braunii]|uniref:Uncharacterized protein n=1 Tax=Chara braunii TaxID=69332 RepID=A0A388LJB1_CHABU|nr:hypothetical protein CBR_g34625 [Chara braunii]|eukprot:GBG82341.1 hypothetical protein CBR_g34625 [Chara braunii]